MNLQYCCSINRPSQCSLISSISLVALVLVLLLSFYYLGQVPITQSINSGYGSVGYSLFYILLMLNAVLQPFLFLISLFGLIARRENVWISLVSILITGGLCLLLFQGGKNSFENMTWTWLWQAVTSQSTK
jgi:hypothetical protein